MPGPLQILAQGRAVLLVVAAPAETDAVCRGMGVLVPRPASPAWDWPLVSLGPGADLIETGVGKVNAAAAVCRRVDPTRHGLVLNLGICGSLPAADPPRLLETVLASRSVYADEGVQTEAGFQSLPEMGFPLGPFEGVAIAGDTSLTDALERFADRVGAIATVSTCSGTDAAAAEVVRRTGAIAEAMEGAAIGGALSRAAPGIPFAELRVVSNTTGDRSKQQWDIRGAFARLGALAAELMA